MKPAMHRLRIVRCATKPLAAFLLLAAVGSAEAGWLDRGIGVAGAGTAVAATMERTTGIFDRMLDAVIKDDSNAVSALEREFDKTPGTIIVKAFPVLDAADAVADRVKSAKRKIGRFVDRAGEGFADARAALATWGDSRNGSRSESALLEGEPLLAAADTKFVEPRFKSPGDVRAALRRASGRKSREAGGKSSASSPGFEQWVIAEQEGRPHCYGAVDPDKLPPDCFGPLGGAKPAEVEQGQWDSSDTRYSDEDRQAARVGFFAARCWGVHGVSRRDPTWNLMKQRMERNECPNGEAAPVASHETGNDYAKALDTALSGGSSTSGAGDYLATLTDLDRKEAERQARLEAEERERQARLEAEERERRLANQINRTYRGGRSGTTSVKSGRFDVNKRPVFSRSRTCRSSTCGQR